MHTFVIPEQNFEGGGNHPPPLDLSVTIYSIDSLGLRAQIIVGLRLFFFQIFYTPYNVYSGPYDYWFSDVNTSLKKKNRQQPNAGDSVRHKMKWYTDEFFVVSVDSIAQGRWRVGISP